MIAGALKIYHKCRSMIFAQIRSTSSSEGLVQDPSVPTCRSGSDTPCISMWYVGYVVGWFTEKDLFLRPPISSNMWLIEPRLFTVHAAMAVPHPRVGHGQGFRKQQTIHIIWKHYSHPPKKTHSNIMVSIFLGVTVSPAGSRDYSYPVLWLKINLRDVHFIISWVCIIKNCEVDSPYASICIVLSS